MEQIVRNKCTENSNVIIPSHISCSPIDETTVNIALNETPPLNDGNNDSNAIISSESIDSNSA